MSTTLIHKTGEVIVSETSPEAEAALRVEQDGWALDYAANGYKGRRKATYASIGDQLDMQYHDLLDDTTTWKDHIAKVKSDNPKPE